MLDIWDFYFSQNDVAYSHKVEFLLLVVGVCLGVCFCLGVCVGVCLLAFVCLLFAVVL